VSFLSLYDDVTGCLQEYKQISELLTEHCGLNDAPPTSKITELLEDTLTAINHIAKHKIPVAELIPEEISEQEQTSTASDKSSSNTVTALNSREDAFVQLGLIAEYFRKTEPHSPVSYIINKAIKWGDMPLEELMNELIPESASRVTYSSLTGVHNEQ